MPFLKTNDGLELHYETQGQGPDVLLIHGLGSSGQDWEYQTEALAQSYRVITLDLRGHGRSSIPSSGYSVSGFAADVRAVMDHLQVATAHVVGISMGGGVAFQLAVESPERVSSLVIINSGPSAKPPGLKFAYMVFVRRIMARFLPPKKFAPKVAGKLFVGENMAEKREKFTSRLAQNSHLAYRKSLNAFLGWSVMDAIPSMQTPTLVIAADMDYTPVSMKQQFVEKMPKAKLTVVENSHHALPMECPERFNPILLEFLQQQTSS